MIDNNQVANYYDKYVKTQLIKGTNERHLILVDVLSQLGLKTNSNIFEIGAGIGIVTKLISKKVKKGKIHTLDISKESIQKNKEINNTVSNITYHAIPVQEFKQDIEFDFVSLFDVMEHIPVEYHNSVFETIANHTHQNSKIIINIPTAEFLEWAHINDKENLQVIDQPLKIHELLVKAYDFDFIPEFFKTYSIWRKDDYQLIILRKKSAWMPEKVNISKNKFKSWAATFLKSF